MKPKPSYETLTGIGENTEIVENTEIPYFFQHGEHNPEQHNEIVPAYPGPVRIIRGRR